MTISGAKTFTEAEKVANFARMIAGDGAAITLRANSTYEALVPTNVPDAFLQNVLVFELGVRVTNRMAEVR